MTFKGHIENGIIKLDEPGELPEGATVRIDIVESSEKTSGQRFLDSIQHLIGKFDDLPTDFSENVDHYLYGTPKK